MNDARCVGGGYFSTTFTEDPALATGPVSATDLTSGITHDPAPYLTANRKGAFSVSSSMRFEAFKPADDKWHKMADAYNACVAAGVDPPRDVERYFNDEPPDPAGVEIPRQDLIASGCITDYEGYEIDVSKLPPDATIVRVYMSY